MEDGVIQMERFAVRTHGQAMQQLTLAIFRLVRGLAALSRQETSRNEGKAFSYLMTRMLGVLTELHVYINRKQIILDWLTDYPPAGKTIDHSKLAEDLRGLADTVGSWPFPNQMQLHRVQESLRLLQSFYDSAAPDEAAAPAPGAPGTDGRDAPAAPAAPQPLLVVEQPAVKKASDTRNSLAEPVRVSAPTIAYVSSSKTRMGKIRVGNKIYYRNL